MCQLLYAVTRYCVCVCVCVFNILLDVFGVYNALMQLGIELFEDLLKLKGETDKDR